MRRCARSFVLVLAFAAVLFCPAPSTYAVVVNGENAEDLLGQFSLPPQGTDTTPVYTTNCINNGASPYGFYNNSVNSQPIKVALDLTNHWLFASDQGNGRILVFPLNSSTNLLSSKTPSYVLGTSSFTACGGNIESAGLAVDPTNHWLYVSNNNLVSVYNTASMSNGEASTYTLGGGSTLQSQLNYNGGGLALDVASQLLYVSDSQNSRVMVFPAVANASWGGSGENALYVLGQTSFSGTGNGTTQSTLNNPLGLAYDSTNKLLHVVDNGNSRVMIFPAYGNASWTGSGENALNVLGQSGFTTANCAGGGNGNGATAAGLCQPEDVAVDSADSLVYVSDKQNNRILVFSTVSLSDGENASYVLGSPNFITYPGINGGGPFTSRSRMDNPSGLASDSTNKLLYANDQTDSRIMIFNVSSWSNGQFSSVTQSGGASCGISSLGALYCWGWANNGAIGDGDPNDNYDVPIEIGSATNWTAISQGDFDYDEAACGIVGGALYCWGHNAYGELGLGNTTQYSTPQQVGSATNWSAVSTSGSDTCGISGGKLYCWGANTYGEVGNGAPNYNTVFVASTSGSPTNGGFGGVTTANTICQNASTAGGSIAPAGTYLAWLATIKNGSTGANDPYTTFTSKTLPYREVNGTLIANGWTALLSGTLANGIALDQTGTAQSGSVWTNVSATTGQASTNGSSANRNCTAWTVGTTSGTTNEGRFGTLGATTSSWSLATGEIVCGTSAYLLCFEQSSATNEVTTPTQIGSATNWTAISQGGPDTCGIAGGQLYCWGRNEFGELGLGNTTEYTTPQLVPLPSGVSSWTAVSQGSYDTCAIANTGALYCWGQNYDGEDGINNTTQQTSPQRVGSATNWTVISIQNDESNDPDACGIAGGALYCWGHNGQDEAGLNNTTQYTTPQQVGSATNWTAVSYGGDSTSAIAGGQLYGWGQNNSGSDGVGSNTQPITTPQAVNIFDINVENATDEIGQYASQISTATVNWAQNSPENGANALGFWGVAGVTMDPVNHHLFVGDFNNDRILVYNLNTDNSIPTTSGGHTAAYVLGALSGFPTSLIYDGYGGLCNGSSFAELSDMAYDTVNNRLFVVSSTGSVVMVFDNMSTITNNMAASYAIGQASLYYCPFGGTTSQAGLVTPIGIALDTVNQRLFVADNGWTNSGQGNRILLFNVAPGTIASGENASYVLGQSSYTNVSCNQGGSAPTQSSVCGPSYVAFDPVNERLFVSDESNNRVLVFNVAPGTIATDENASYVLGVSNFTTTGSTSCSQTSTAAPQGLAYDATNSRLFVYQGACANVMVFNVGPGVIKNGEKASFELGQSNFTNGNGGTTQNSFINNANLSGGINLYYDPGSLRLFVTDAGNNRVMIFDVSFANPNFMQMLPD